MQYLASNDDAELDIILVFLSTLIGTRADAILELLSPYLASDETWDLRIAFCLSRLENWQNDAAVNVLQDLIGRGNTGARESSFFFHLAKSNPEAGCKVLRAYLDRRFDELVEADRRQAGKRWCLSE